MATLQVGWKADLCKEMRGEIIIYIKGDNEQTFRQAVLGGIRDVALMGTEKSSCENNLKNASF